MSAACPTHLILLDLITLLICGKVYKLQSSSLYSLLQPPATSSQVQIFSSAPCSQIPSIHVLPLVWKTKFCDMYSHEEYDEVDWQQLQLLLFPHDHQKEQNKYKASMLQDSCALEMMGVLQSLVWHLSCSCLLIQDAPAQPFLNRLGLHSRETFQHLLLCKCDKT